MCLWLIFPCYDVNCGTDFAYRYIQLFFQRTTGELKYADELEWGGWGYGTWNNINDIFDDKYEIVETLKHISWWHQERMQPISSYSIYDYGKINQHGINFLESINCSNSLEEFKLKLQIIGYEI